MRNNQWIILSAILFLTFVAVQLVSAGGGGGGYGHGHGQGHGGGGHGHGGRHNGTRNQCNQAQQFFNQWWPQSQLAAAFQTVCRQVGAAQAWNNLQGLLGVSATGALDQATFQALLNNNNQALLVQQFLALVGG